MAILNKITKYASSQNLKSLIFWTRQICDTFPKTTFFGLAKSATPSQKQLFLDSPNLWLLPENSLVWNGQICDTFHKTALFGQAKSVTPSTQQPCLDWPNLWHLPHNRFWEGVTDLVSPKIRDFKLWLLAYLLILFNCAKFQKDRTHFKRVPLDFFLFL